MGEVLVKEERGLLKPEPSRSHEKKFEKRLARSKSCCYYNRMNTMTALQQQGQSRLQQSLQVMRLRG